MLVSDAMYHDEEEDTHQGRPRPMALVSSTKRKAEDVPEEEPPVSGMRRTVSAPPVLAPMSEVKSSSFGRPEPEEDSGRVYFPVSVDLDSLVDWRQVGPEENNNDDTLHLQKAALVKVNNKEVAVFKYGEDVIGE